MARFWYCASLDERLFCLTHKVCRYNEVHRQHKQCKEQQSRAEDQIHDPLFDVFFYTLPQLIQLIPEAPYRGHADPTTRLQQLFGYGEGFRQSRVLYLRVETPYRVEQPSS